MLGPGLDLGLVQARKQRMAVDLLSTVVKLVTDSRLVVTQHLLAAVDKVLGVAQVELLHTGLRHMDIAAERGVWLRLPIPIQDAKA